MKISAGINWGKGEYICNKCGKKQILSDNKEILQQCNCGEILFNLKMAISRSENGLADKLSEAITIIEVSIFLYKILKLNEFLAVISIQLRILLCDGKNSLLPKVINGPLFYPCKDEFLSIRGAEIIMENNLFDAQREKISIDDWLSQIIYRDNRTSINIPIKDIIRSWADTNGGAHVDNELEEDELYALAFFREHLLMISEYLITELGFDLKEDIKNKVIIPYNQIVNQPQE
jgi:hypothetical protein